jgi:hypothetical protein
MRMAVIYTGCHAPRKRDIQYPQRCDGREVCVLLDRPLARAMTAVNDNT